MILLVYALGLPAAAAWFLLRTAWPGGGAAGVPRALPACLAGGLGLGLASCYHFLWYPVFGPPGAGFVAFELLLVGAAVAGWQRWAADAPPPPADPPTWTRRLWLPFAAVAVLAFRYLVGFYLREPHGDWDAYAIWNLRARFLYRAADDWRDTFSPIIWHADYPLLLPAGVARLWLYAGEEATVVPFVLAVVMVGLTAGVLVSGLNLLRGGGQGWLAGTALLCSYTYVYTARLQYADIPLGFFVLATAVAFALHDRAGRAGWFFPALAGAMAGLAAWTKNEGQLLLVAAVLARAVVAARDRAWAAAAREFAWFAAGLAPAGAALLVFKAGFAPPNDLVAGQSASTLDRLADLARHEQIARRFAGEVWEVAPYMVAVLGAYALLVGRPPAGRRGPGVLTPALIVALMTAGYYLVYLTTPHDLTWHLGTSSLRLLAQLWPLALFTLFLGTASLDEAGGRVSPHPRTGRPH